MTRSYCYQPFQPAPFLSASATADVLQIVVNDVDVVDVVLDVYRIDDADDDEKKGDLILTIPRLRSFFTR
jgi:hypothetical protein